MPGAERIHCLQDILKDNGLAGAVLFHSGDVYYYTNTAQPSYPVIRASGSLMQTLHNKRLSG